MSENNLPLQVYLDNGDFSALATAGMSSSPEAAALRGIETQLVAMQSQGLIQLRFSYFHVIEAAPVDKASIPFAEARFQKIQSLCGNHCFASALSLIDEEVKHPGEMTAYRKNRLCRDDGNWLADRIALHMSKRFAIEQIQQHADSLSRAAKRKFLSESLDSKGNPRLMALDRLQIPFRSLLNWNKPDVTDREIIEPIINLCNFIDRYKTRWNEAVKLSAWLRERGQFLNQQTLQAIEQLQKSKDLLVGKNEKLRAFLPQVISEAAEDGKLSHYASLVAEFAKSLGIPPTHCEFSDAMTLRPATASFVTMVSEIRRRKVTIQGKNNQPLASDLGDAFHCAYIPYVDIFRPDKNTAKVLCEAMLPFPTRIVAKLVELPEAIQQELETRRTLTVPCYGTD